MSITDWVLVGLACWCVLSVPFALWVGRAIRLADRRANERYDELAIDLMEVEDAVHKLTAARSATRVMPVVRPLSQTAVPTQSTGKHAHRG